jgi:exodeoxyribonuclease VII large subunit
MLAESRQTLDLLSARQGRSMAVTYRHKREKLISISGKLHALSPLATLGRGYAVVETDTGKPVRKSSEIAPGDRVRIRLHEGEADADIIETRD